MLTADLVDARRKDRELVLRPLDAPGRAEALDVAESYIDIARRSVGKRREEVEEAWDAAVTDAEPRLVKLAAGLRKLLADTCSFEAEISIDPALLRRVLFGHASRARRALEPGEPFDRERVLATAAEELGLEPDVVERAMFADLKGEHVLRAVPPLAAASLVESWEVGQAQAVLLAAVRVTCEIATSSPGLVRAFFAKLKFHQLLFSTERTDAGWRVVIDGPYSMFDSVTKYGLRLACILPALRALERWSLAADVRWGKKREALVFRLSSRSGFGGGGGRAANESRDDELHLADEVRELMEGINALDAGWRARPATAILDVPGEGVAIPDLELETKKGRGGKQIVYVEVLGYWSRDAVFRRVELAERGLGARVVFAVSSRLRVSADVLDASVPACLYVYKGKMSPRAVAERARALLK